MLLRIAAGILLTAAGLAAQDGPPADSGRVLHLAADDFRWMKISVRQTPAEVDCRYEVIQGNPSVHVELLPLDQFRLLDRGRDHDTLAVTPAGRRGDFRRIVETPGQYAVVVVNAKNAPPATVSLEVSASVNPNLGDVARTLPPRRQLTVVLISFAFFFVSVSWSAHKLIRNMRS